MLHKLSDVADAAGSQISAHSLNSEIEDKLLENWKMLYPLLLAPIPTNSSPDIAHHPLTL